MPQWAYWMTMIPVLLRSLGRCSHRQCQHEEGCYDCPDCHQPVVTRWVVYRCTRCHRIRPVIRLFGQGVLTQLQCHCGEKLTVAQAVAKAHYFSVASGAVLITQRINSNIYWGWANRAVLPALQQVWVWVQPSGYPCYGHMANDC